jgi:hypothetical protein
MAVAEEAHQADAAAVAAAGGGAIAAVSASTLTGVAGAEAAPRNASEGCATPRSSEESSGSARTSRARSFPEAAAARASATLIDAAAGFGCEGFFALRAGDGGGRNGGTPYMGGKTGKGGGGGPPFAFVGELGWPIWAGFPPGTIGECGGPRKGDAGTPFVPGGDGKGIGYGNGGFREPAALRGTGYGHGGTTGEPSLFTGGRYGYG